ncbi:MAG: hypothetical protein R6V01_10715 [Thermoplasmatota archaeon]
MLTKFEIYNDGEYWCARGIRDDIFTQGRTMDELIRNLQEAVELHFEDEIERAFLGMICPVTAKISLLYNSNIS